MSSAGRTTALRAGGACVRCRKGKTKCTYDTGRPPCRNCLKGNHDCYLPSESHAHLHGQSPARAASSTRAPRDSLPASGPGGASDARQAAASAAQRHAPVAIEKLTPELIAECERVISKTYPACVAFHKPSFVQQLKNGTLESTLVYGLLACAARSSPTLIRRYGGTPTQAADSFATKALSLINQNLDQPNLADIQALCLIIVHEWGSRNAVSAYIYLGQAARMLQMFRILNNHHPSDHADQFLRDESFRRTLWLIYILDCLLTSTPGRFPALNVQDTADVSLPCIEMNYAFGNGVYVKTLLQELNHTTLSPTHPPTGEIGEYGYIIVAATLWRDVVGMLTTRTLHSFREDDCFDLIAKIDGLRTSLPMQLVDKPGQINLHMTMGSGFNYAMLHCFLHCATIFVHRRRLLQEVTSRNFNLEQFRMSSRCHELVDHLFTSSHCTLGLVTAVEQGTDKESMPCYPIFMLFSVFTASATVAYLSLKGLTPPTAVETASHIVTDGLRFMHEGTENWPLMGSWLRHLSVMQRVINNDAALNNGQRSGSHTQLPSIKDEVASNADSNPDPMDFDQQSNSGSGGLHLSAPRSVSETAREASEPPTSIPRRPGVATINGGPNSVTSPPATSPPANTSHIVPEVKHHSPGATSNGGAPASNDGGHATSQDMTAPELCQAFERQLLDLDDLAAFMGGGV